MKLLFTVGLAVLLTCCELGHGKATPGRKDLCPAGPVPDGCPFPDNELSTFFPHANDCHWFFHCSNGVPYCKVCPANLHWNQALETCDYPERAGCTASGSETTKIPTPETPKPTTAAPETPKPTTKEPAPPQTTAPSNDCPAGKIPACPVRDPDFSVFFPHENDCHWFYQCSNGVAHCKICPDGLHWNPNLDTCDWPENAGCGSGTGHSTTKNPDPSTAVTPTSAAPETPKPTTVKPASTTSDPSEDCPAGTVPTCPVPDPDFSVFFPHENDCHWFYHCSNGVAYCKICPPGLHWNPILDTCDWPENAGCGSGSAPSTTKKPDPSTTVKPNRTTTAAPETPKTTEKPASTTPDPSSVCPAGVVPTCPVRDPEFSVFFPHGNDCHWYYQCSNGVAYCKVCPADLHWNPILETCDRPENAGCGSESVPTTTKKPDTPTTPSVITTTKKPETPIPSTVGPTPTSDPSGDCPAGRAPSCPFPDPEFSVFFPHENDCHWFYHCSNGVAYCKVCPADLHWNPDKDTCDYSYRAGCSS